MRRPFVNGAREGEGETERDRQRTFEVRHLLPFLPVALRVDPGFCVADLPGRRQLQSRHVGIATYGTLVADECDRLRRALVAGVRVPTYNTRLADERDGLRRALHSSTRVSNSPGRCAPAALSGTPKIPARNHQIVFSSRPGTCWRNAKETISRPPA